MREFGAVEGFTDPSGRSSAEVYASAAALYVVLLKHGYTDEAAEFAEWFLETFDLDLET